MAEGQPGERTLSRIERFGRRADRRLFGGLALRLVPRRAGGLASRPAAGLLGNTVSTMLFSVLILLLNMATGVLTARWLGPEGRGLQMILVLWPQFFAFTTTLGIPAALLYHMKKTPDKANDLYAAGMLMALLTGAGAIGIGFLFIPFRLAGQPDWLVLSGVALMAFVPFVHLFFLNNAWLRARQQFKLFNRTRYMVPLLTLVLLAAWAVADRLTPLTAAVSYQLAYVPIALWAMAKGLRLLRIRWTSLRQAIAKLFRYGVRGYGVDLLGNLILYIDQILLIGLLAPEALGLYVVAVSLSRMLNVFSTSIVVVLFPEASGLEEEEAAKLSLMVYKISTLLGLFAASVLALLAPLVLGLLYGSAFLAAIPVFRLLVLEVVIGGAALVLAQAFMAVGKPGVASLSQGLGLLVLVPLMLVLVPQYGVIGAGWSLLIAATVRLLYVLVRFHVRFRLGFRALWLSREDVNRVIEVVRKRKAALVRREGR